MEDDGVGDDTCPYPVVSKLDSLPIERNELGYFQRSRYQNPDLCDEEVMELDTPFAMHVASGTRMLTFLLLGDQNAGKSSFIHSFCYADDPSYLTLQSYLPILSASFHNARFLSRSSDVPARDELPFLDTDIARASFLMTVDSFSFFLQEFGIQGWDDLEPDLRYVMVQFIELGGDHLDQMMSGRAHCADAMGDTLERSLSLLQEARKTVYFVNCQTLVEPMPCTDTSTTSSMTSSAAARTSTTASTSKTCPGGPCTCAGESCGCPMEKGTCGGNSPQACACSCHGRSLAVKASSLATLLARLDYLSRVLPHGHEVLLCFSRLPPAAAFDRSAVTASRAVAQQVAGFEHRGPRQAHHDHDTGAWPWEYQGGYQGGDSRSVPKDKEKERGGRDGHQDGWTGLAKTMGCAFASAGPAPDQHQLRPVACDGNRHGDGWHGATHGDGRAQGGIIDDPPWWVPRKVISSVSNEDLSSVDPEVDEELSRGPTGAGGPADASYCHPLIAWVATLLERVACQRGWGIRFTGVVPGRHVADPVAGSLDVGAVVATTVALFAHSMTHSVTTPDALVVKHLLEMSREEGVDLFPLTTSLEVGADLAPSNHVPYHKSPDAPDEACHQTFVGTPFNEAASLPATHMGADEFGAPRHGTAGQPPASNSGVAGHASATEIGYAQATPRSKESDSLALKEYPQRLLATDRGDASAYGRGIIGLDSAPTRITGTNPPAPASRRPATDRGQAWLSAGDLSCYLSSLEFLDAPPTLLLQRFGPVAGQLASAGLGLAHAGEGHASLAVRFQVKGADGRCYRLVWSPRWQAMAEMAAPIQQGAGPERRGGSIYGRSGPVDSRASTGGAGDEPGHAGQQVLGALCGPQGAPPRVGPKRAREAADDVDHGGGHGAVRVTTGDEGMVGDHFLRQPRAAADGGAPLGCRYVQGHGAAGEGQRSGEQGDSGGFLGGQRVAGESSLTHGQMGGKGGVEGSELLGIMPANADGGRPGSSPLGPEEAAAHAGWFREVCFRFPSHPRLLAVIEALFVQGTAGEEWLGRAAAAAANPRAPHPPPSPSPNSSLPPPAALICAPPPFGPSATPPCLGDSDMHNAARSDVGVDGTNVDARGGKEGGGSGEGGGDDGGGGSRKDGGGGR
eukprot:jgi/Mesvir1/25564/Mv01798-RA.3